MTDEAVRLAGASSRRHRAGIGTARTALRGLLPRAVDLGALILLAAIAYAGVRDLFGAADLVTGGGDWHAQAYRVEDLRRRGLASWTHDWAGGLPLWSAYQFVPHVVTRVAVDVLDVGVTQAMTVLQAVVLVALPMSMFLCLRLAGLGAGAALLGGLLSIALDMRRQPVSTFSELWGLVLAPPLLLCTYRTAGRRAGFATAIAIGASVYVHPLALLTGGVGMIAALLAPPPRPAGAGEARGSSATRIGTHDPRPAEPHDPAWGDDAAERSDATARTAVWLHRSLHGVVALAPWCTDFGARLLLVTVQLAVAMGVAAFFLWPVFDSARPVYENPYFTSAEFQRLLGRLAAGSFAPAWRLWLPLACLAALAVAGMGAAAQRAGARFLVLVAAIVLALAVSAMQGQGPRLVLNAQAPRLLSLLPLVAATSGALCADALLARVRRHRTVFGRRRPEPAALGLGVLCLTLMFALVGQDRTRLLGVMSATPTPSSPFTRWLLTLPPRPAGTRIVAPPETVADASFFAYGQAWYTGSYSGREWSILAGPLGLFMEGFGAPETRGAYLVAMAADLAVVPAGVRPELRDPRDWQPAGWEEVASLEGLDVLRLPWPPVYAFAIPAGAEAGLEVPDTLFDSVETAYVRDELTRRYAALARSDAAVVARVHVRSGTTVDLELRALPPGRVLLVSENWDRSWRAEAGGRQLPVMRAGPNLLRVDLADVPAPVLGDVHVRLVHDRPRGWWEGLAVSLAAAGVGLAAFALGRRDA